MFASWLMAFNSNFQGSLNLILGRIQWKMNGSSKISTYALAWCSLCPLGTTMSWYCQTLCSTLELCQGLSFMNNIAVLFQVWYSSCLNDTFSFRETKLQMNKLFHCSCLSNTWLFPITRAKTERWTSKPMLKTIIKVSEDRIPFLLYHLTKMFLF